MAEVRWLLLHEEREPSGSACEVLGLFVSWEAADQEAAWDAYDHFEDAHALYCEEQPLDWHEGGTHLLLRPSPDEPVQRDYLILPLTVEDCGPSTCQLHTRQCRL